VRHVSEWLDAAAAMVPSLSGVDCTVLASCGSGVTIFTVLMDGPNNGVALEPPWLGLTYRLNECRGRRAGAGSLAEWVEMAAATALLAAWLARAVLLLRGRQAPRRESINSGLTDADLVALRGVAP
jgi:hypothetical protein